MEMYIIKGDNLNETEYYLRCFTLIYCRILTTCYVGFVILHIIKLNSLNLQCSRKTGKSI